MSWRLRRGSAIRAHRRVCRAMFHRGPVQGRVGPLVGAGAGDLREGSAVGQGWGASGGQRARDAASGCAAEGSSYPPQAAYRSPPPPAWARDLRNGWHVLRLKGTGARVVIFVVRCAGKLAARAQALVALLTPR